MSYFRRQQYPFLDAHNILFQTLDHNVLRETPKVFNFIHLLNQRLSSRAYYSESHTEM